MTAAEFWGGIGEYGRACYYFSIKDISFLFDCGINKDTGNIPKLIPDKVKKLDYVFLSHSHKDHSWAIPELYKNGYNKQIIMNRDTAYQLKDFLEIHRDIRVSVLEEWTVPCEWHKLNPNISICWGNSGHMPGAIWYIVDIYDKKIFYTGDYNSDSKILLHHDPAELLKNDSIDFAIVDCANGIDEVSYDSCIAQILRQVENTINNGGNVLFPAQIYGRSIELYILLKRKFKMTEFIITRAFYEAVQKFIGSDYRINDIKNMDFFENTSIINNIEDSKYYFRANNNPKIIFTGNVSNTDKIALYFFDEIKTLRYNKIIFTSREPKGSIGEWGLKHSNELEADILSMGIKSHQGIREVRKLLNSIKTKKAILCHANGEKMMMANQILQNEGYDNIINSCVGNTIRF